jgi:hypothetical protein
MASPARLSLAGLVAAAVLCPALGAQVRTADTAQAPTSSNRRIVRTAGHLSPLPAPTGDAGSWPSFRGVRASGFAEGQLLPDTWDVRTGENILWRIPIPGLAHSSPIVWGDRIFVTTAISSRTNATFKPGLYGAGTPSDDTSGHRWVVYAIDKRTGTIIWERVAYEGEPIEKRIITFTGTLNGDEIAFVRTVQVKEGGAPGGAGLFGVGGPPAFVAVRAKKPSEL